MLTMGSMRMQFVLCLALFGAVLSIPHSHTVRAGNALAQEFDADWDAPTPVPTSGCMAHINQTECSADKCCNWCGPKLPPIPVPIPAVGFCMPMLPVATSLVCDKSPTSCKLNIINATCALQSECKWIPTGPPLDPTGKGICMYDWDACKVPPATPSPAQASLSKVERKHEAIKRLARKHAKRAVHAPIPPAPKPVIGCMTHINQTDCSSDKCCNWCGPKMPPTPVPIPAIGFCMPMLPVATSLVCDKAPTSCKLNILNATCALQSECKWIPTAPPLDPTGKGICMYDWDACKVPPTPPATPAPADAPLSRLASVARKHARGSRTSSVAAVAPVAAPVPPVPKLNCTLPTAEECDANKCCQWCGSAWNTTAPGWCMPVLDEPMPMMTCSKGAMSCSTLPAAVCNKSDTCSWMPFGPPSSPMGVCLFDFKKCLV